MSYHKRNAGDRWGLVSIDINTGEERLVQIGYWESPTFPYKKQAQEYADMYNKESQETNRGKKYEVRFAGNYRLKLEGDGHTWLI